MNRTATLLLLCSLVSGLTAPTAAAQDTVSETHRGGPADSAAVARVVSGFHDALAAGDSARVLELLAPEARILEGGGVETRSEYAAHHLGADMAFAGAVPRQRGPLSVTVRGDVAWVTSISIAQGTYRDREIDSRVAELAVVSRHGDAWRIEAVHWSSR